MVRKIDWRRSSPNFVRSSFLLNGHEAVLISRDSELEELFTLLIQFAI